MADTARTKSALATLLADNTTGAISPQDVRDFLETMHPSFGSLYFSSSAATTVVTPGTFVKAAGTTTSVTLHRVTMPANNRLTYTGTPDIHTHIAGSMSMTTASNNQIISVGIAKNGTLLAHSEVQRKVGTGSDIGSTATHADATMSTNDYLEVFLTNNTSASTVTLDYCYLFVLGMMT